MPISLVSIDWAGSWVSILGYLQTSDKLTSMIVLLRNFESEVNESIIESLALLRVSIELLVTIPSTIIDPEFICSIMKPSSFVLPVISSKNLINLLV